MPGGFVGVDVFFVISGYLITSIIMREIQQGSFSILSFYERRIRRIFPALFAVIVATIVVASLLFVPDDLYNAAQSGIAATFFAANILFFLEAGYFDIGSYQKPLLHTWSLGIEEQFYIVLPLLMLLLARWRLRMAVWIGVLTAVSLALSVATTEAMPTAAYYLLPWRAWELGIGALLALGVVPPLSNTATREATGLFGLALIIGAAVLITKETAFPGAAALAPTLGAAMLIHAGAGDGKQPLASRLLSTSGPVWIGRISYSLYLWHWPLIVFFVYYGMKLPSGAEAVVLFALALVLAWISWRFVEQPFRRRSAGERRAVVFGGAAVGMAAVTLAAGVVVVGKGFPGRLSEDMQGIAAFSHDFEDRRSECFRRKAAEASWLEPCLYGTGEQPAQVALWGDSHAPAQIPALDVAAKERGLSVALYAADGCPPIDEFQVYWIGQDHSCTQYLDATYPAVIGDPHIELVVLSMRSPIYTEGWLPYGLAERDRTPLLIGDRSAPLPDGTDRAAFYFAGLERTVAALRAANKDVALVYPTPEAGFSVPNALVRMSIRDEVSDPTLAREVFDARAANIVKEYDRLVELHGVIPIRLDNVLCDAKTCNLVMNDVPVFRDSNHFSATTARSLAPEFGAVIDLVNPEKWLEQ